MRFVSSSRRRQRALGAAVAFSLVLSVSSFVVGSTVAVASPPASATDDTKVPHYFGPWSNWANSPFTLSNAAVTIGGNGAGAAATATVDPQTGAILPST